MNILFYKLLAHKELKEEAEYILNSRDTEYTLENHIINTGYNPIEKLKELEDDIDAQVLRPEIYDLVKNKNTSSLDETIEHLSKLDKLINDSFKFYGIFITKQIYDYLIVKKIAINSGEVL